MRVAMHRKGPTGRSRDILHTAKGDHLGRVHSGQKVLGKIRQGRQVLFDRRPRVYKLIQGPIRLKSTQIRKWMVIAGI
jgi:hypothetical protein